MGNIYKLYQHKNDLFVDSFDDIILKLMQKSQSSKLKSLLFCGCEPGVGTTTITINIAVSLARGNNKTLLIDSDMRKSAKSKRLSEESQFGLSDFIAGNNTVEDIINQTNFDNLDYITCGTQSSQSVKLLMFKSLNNLISSIYESYDFILFDSPSLDAVNDSIAISILVDGIFLVSELERTTKTNIRKTVQQFSKSDNKVLGMLVNKVDEPEYRMYMKNYDYFNKKRDKS